MSERIRLQKFFTDCGVFSRRTAEAEIAACHVCVNGLTAKLGDKIDPTTDIVEYRGKRILPPADSTHHYFMLNKPCGYVTTAKDEKGRRTVMDLMQNTGVRVYPVGRLDMNSEGLLLLTDDGELTNRLTHPRHEIPKIYHVTLSASPSATQLRQLASPMILDGYALQPIGVTPLSANELELTLYEGRNRQIRKMCAAVGLKITVLRRVAIGNLTLGTLPSGKWRSLTAKEIEYLKSPQKNERN